MMILDIVSIMQLKLVRSSRSVFHLVLIVLCRILETDNVFHSFLHLSQLGNLIGLTVLISSLSGQSKMVLFAQNGTPTSKIESIMKIHSVNITVYYRVLPTSPFLMPFG